MFGKSITLFRLFGFAVRIDLTWIFIAVLVTWSLAEGIFPAQLKGQTTVIYWVMGVLGAVGLFLSIIFHELCHSLVARRFGLEMSGITLFIFGGVAEMTEEPRSPKAEFFMAAAGPLSSIVLGLAVLAVARFMPGPFFHPTSATKEVLLYLGEINLILAAFNLIPAFPLDGGRVLRAILWGRHGNIKRATRVTSSIGSGFGAILIVLGVVSFITGSFVAGVWWFLIGMFLRGAASQSYRQLLLRRELEGEPVRRFMTTEPVTVDPELYVRDLVEQYVFRTHHKLYPVVDEDRLMGCVTLAQVKGVPRDKWDWTRVRDLASGCSEENTLSPDTDAMEALTRMRRHHVSRLMVVEGGHLVGILSLKDLMNFLSMKVELDAS
jgi:Zn-dependent protease/predicted transcriptional regulator